ncbi:hypothetical protein DY000_02035767 [Brassica cretica]|uniref:Protein kinase domain-containing protein n=1 Tax=Brassica cretica TaxID=69181 RepID=A0ABQ7DTS8_BRACR|nr:hypothetical protein DY000_02035767 [Brassica cretica]
MGICNGKPIEQRSRQSRRQVSAETNETSEVGLNKSFGFSRHFSTHYEIDGQVGRGDLGLKGQEVAVKVIHKAKVCFFYLLELLVLDSLLSVFQLMNALMVEDVSREVKIMSALTGHKNLVQFYDAFEDDENVYIVMELCKGGNLFERGCEYAEDDAKQVMVQILSVVAYCHLQGVVHRDLKPEHFLFSTKDETSPLKAVGFGFSAYVKPDERLNDIVGSSLHVAPEVLHRAYGTESDMWMVGVMTYVLLSGSRPFWAPTEYELFRAVLKTEPSFEEAPWPSLSPDAVDFVKRLLHKDYRKRLTAAQALCHPWLVGSHERGYELFEKDGNRPIMTEELASELRLGPSSVPMHVVLQDWIRQSDGKFSFLGFVRLLHGGSSQTLQKA